MNTTLTLRTMLLHGLACLTFTAVQTLSFAQGHAVWSWGWNLYGQIGGLTQELSTPHQALASGGIADVSAGVGHTILLDQSGDLWAVGLNHSGQLGDGTKTTRLALVRVAGLSDALSVSSGTSHNLALLRDGTVWSWGNNYYGQLGDAFPLDRTLPALVPELSDVQAVDAGDHHNLALLANGAVVAWGRNTWGQLGNGTFAHYGLPTLVQGLTTAVQISAGGYHNLALLHDGTVWAWGSNWEGQLGDNTNLDRNVPIQVDGLSDVIYVAATGRSSFAITSNGDLWAWGANDECMLGIGYASEPIRRPIKVSTIIGVTAIDGSSFHTIALRNDGTVWSWGANWQGELGDHGQLGDGRLSFLPYPRQVLGVLGACKIAARYAHGLAVADRQSAGPVPSQIIVSPEVVYGGSTVELTIQLNRSAPQGGTSILIATSGSNLVASSSITVPEGATSASAQLQVRPVAASQERVLIHASTPGRTRRTILYVNRPFLAGLAIDPPVVPGSFTATGSVVLNAPAPDGGIEIALYSDDSAASVPSRVVVPAGEASATFAIETSAVGGVQRRALITATQGGTMKRRYLYINPPYVSSISFNPDLVIGGNAAVGTITLNAPAPEGGFTVLLDSDNSAAPVPSSVQVLAGDSSVSFIVATSGAGGSLVRALISASGGGATKRKYLYVR